MKSDFAAFAITFNRPETLIETLDIVRRQTVVPEKILVVDNGNSEETRNALEGFWPDVIEYASMPENLGPAGAAAFGLRKLAKRGYRYIHWIDDDDPPRLPDVFERLLRVFTENSSARVGAVGATGCRMDWRTGRLIRLADKELQGFVDVDSIAGGMQFIVSGDAVREVGVPNPQMFFGFEELEYCLRLRMYGYRLLIDGDLRLEHRRRRGHLNRPSGRRPTNFRDESELWRSYYSTRNYIWMMNNTFKRRDLAYREVARALARSGLAFRRGVRYGSKHLEMQTRGIIDAYLRRTGRRIPPSGAKVRR